MHNCNKSHCSLSLDAYHRIPADIFQVAQTQDEELEAKHRLTVSIHGESVNALLRELPA